MYLYLLVFVCLYVYFDVLHSLHVVCRLVYLTHFHFCTHIQAVVIICVCQIFIKETACLLACLNHPHSQLTQIAITKNLENKHTKLIPLRSVCAVRHLHTSNK